MTSAFPKKRTQFSVDLPAQVDRFTKNNAVRADLAALQANLIQPSPSSQMGDSSLSVRLHQLATSLRDTSDPIRDEISRAELNDPLWRQENIKTVESIIKARRRREFYFDLDLFADPAWDILLSLFRAELIQCRTCTTNLCIDANVPTTTALRWIKLMADAGILVRRVDPLDGRRTFLELSKKTSDSMARFIADFRAS